MKTFEIHNADCREVMKSLPANSIDSIVTDPPYGLEFMGKGWDRGVPGVEFWTEALRVLKPGGHLLAFGGTRTFHRLTVAIEDSGFEIRDCLGWIYGSGFPKSHNISKAIDRAAGAEREAIGKGQSGPAAGMQNLGPSGIKGGEFEITAPATPEAAEWAGWGTALKPAWEPIILARKPLAGTVAENVLEFRTGGLNIDGARVGAEGGGTHCTNRDENGKCKGHLNAGRSTENETFHGPDISGGRWPANILHDGSEEVVAGFPDVKAGVAVNRNRQPGTFNSWMGTRQGGVGDDVGYGDSGSAARFFYCAKASKADRNEGLDEFQIGQTTGGGGGIGKYAKDVNSASGKFGSEKAPARNIHPTVKPSALMRYLCRLVTAPGGLILDPFAGSGSTGKAAIAEGFRFVGAELDPAYAEIARARCEAAAAKLPAEVHIESEEPAQLDLFGEG